MKRILLFLSMLLCLTAEVLAQGCPWPPRGGDNTPLHKPRPTRSPRATGTIPVLRSGDPNEIEGPIGYDSVRWVSINDILNYTIRFENDPKIATAAAQIVDVRFDFPNKLWMKDFGIGSYCFSNLAVAVNKPSNAYQNRVDLKDSLGIYVDIIAGLDVVKKQGFWNFSTLDAETGTAPWEPDRGLLPVNDSLTHVGEGFVTFQLKPHTDVKTGDSISIMAKIVFDQNDTIPTNRWCNLIDAGNPESKVSAEIHPTLPNVYNLTFTAQDDEKGSGVKHLLLYLANHNGIYEEIDTVSVDTVLAFPIETGKQYKLYSLAVDNTGNREPAKENPDVILNFNQAPTDLLLSESTFQDDLEAGGFIGQLTTVDSEDEKTFTYALAEGDGAIHNDMFQITNDRLEIKNSFKCADGECFNVRISTTDNGGMSYSKPFELNLKKVLVKPEMKTLEVNICEGESCVFNDVEYKQSGIYHFSKENEFMCDSLYELRLTVLPRIEMPLVTIEGSNTLVSSADNNNQWFRQDGTPVAGATGKKFTPDEDGVYYVAVSNGSCYSDPSQLYRVVLTDRMDLQMDLQEGWNWVSSNMTGDVSRLVGVSSELTNDPQYGLVGNLSTLEPEQGYKLQMTQMTNNTWSGLTAKPETTTIRLHKGWNWIGYVPTTKQGLANALMTLDASENAVIKTEDDFATYTGGQWTGSLDELNPGKGYMYYADKEVEFTYPVTRVFEIAAGSRKDLNAMARAVAPWNYNEHKYPDNTTVIARLNVNGSEAIEGTYSVGAFCGKECRGIGKYVNGLLFITIHGTLSADKQITFKAAENLTGTELDVNETLKFQGQNIGTVASPFILNATGESTGIEEVGAAYTIYPRPLRSKMYINGPTENIKTVSILSTNGQKIIVADGYSAEGIDVGQLLSGIYVVAITTSNGQTSYEKIIKANK